MTALAVLRLCRRYDLKIDREEIAICNQTTWVRGTIANLREGDCLTIEQLLYGLMLPSGNDSAFVLANHFG
jgi:serine-type D-Ala-D-Ala carboxypeptidase (penicillin-binding protein 5/6)